MQDAQARGKQGVVRSATADLSVKKAGAGGVGGGKGDKGGKGKGDKGGKGDDGSDSDDDYQDIDAPGAGRKIGQKTMKGEEEEESEDEGSDDEGSDDEEAAVRPVDASLEKSDLDYLKSRVRKNFSDDEEEAEAGGSGEEEESGEGGSDDEGAGMQAAEKQGKDKRKVRRP